MPGLPNYRRILGAAEVVKDQWELRATQGNPDITLISGSGAFGTITNETEEFFQIAFDVEEGQEAAPKLRTYIADYEGDEGAFELDTLSPIGCTIPLDNDPAAFYPVHIGAVTAGIAPVVFRLVATADDPGVEKSGTPRIYADIDVEPGDPITITPVGLLLTIPLSKTYNPA